MNTQNIVCFVMLVIVSVNTQPWPTYRLIAERTAVPFVNREYVLLYVRTFKYNRTSIAASGNFTVLKPLPSNTVVVVKAYEFLNNEYKPFAVNIRRSLCPYLENEYKLIFYPSMPDFIPPKCPLLPGTYTLNNYIPQANKLPANLPFNKMMFEITFVAGQLQIVQFQAYVLFDRDVMIREQFS